MPGTNVNELEIHRLVLKSRKSRVATTELVLGLRLIGWDGGVSFWRKSQSVGRQNDTNCELCSMLSWQVLFLTRLIAYLEMICWSFQSFVHVFIPESRTYLYYETLQGELLLWRQRQGKLFHFQERLMIWWSVSVNSWSKSVLIW